MRWTQDGIMAIEGGKKIIGMGTEDGKMAVFNDELKIEREVQIGGQSLAAVQMKERIVVFNGHEIVSINQETWATEGNIVSKVYPNAMLVVQEEYLVLVGNSRLENGGHMQILKTKGGAIEEVKGAEHEQVTEDRIYIIVEDSPNHYLIGGANPGITLVQMSVSDFKGIKTLWKLRGEEHVSKIIKTKTDRLLCAIGKEICWVDKRKSTLE